MKKMTGYNLLQIVSAIIFLLCILYLLTGKTSLVCRGFAVDQDGRVYIGRLSQIEIYENGSRIDSISSLTNRGYAFTIENDTILLSTVSTVYEMDLSGNVQATYADTMSRVYYAHTENRQFTDGHGNVYKRSAPWGRLQITCQGKLCYQMPIWDCVCLWAMIISFLTLLCTNALLVIKKYACH